MRLTDLTIKNLPFTERGQKRIRDDALPGFGVVVGKRSKSFFVMFGVKRQVRTIGKYPEISLRDARKEALAIINRPGPKTRTWSHSRLVTAFLEHCQSNLRPSTTRRYGCALKKSDPSSPQEVAAFKAMYNWGLRMGHVDHNPYQHRQAIFNKRDRLLEDHEIRALWNYEDGVFSDIVKMLILTGQRRAQIAGLQQEWIKDDTITFPSGVMKSKRPHSIPFNLMAAKYVKPMSFNGWGKSKARMDKITGVTGWVLHDLRRYYSTTMAKIGVPLHVTEHLLDHRASTSGVQQVYMQYGFLPEMREAVLKYESHLWSLVNCQPTR